MNDLNSPSQIDHYKESADSLLISMFCFATLLNDFKCCKEFKKHNLHTFIYQISKPGLFAK